MKHYRIDFYRGIELLTTGHGNAHDEDEAQMKAEFALMAMYEGIKYDRVEVIEEYEID